MDTVSIEKRSVTISVSIYRRLIAAYPAAFRMQYGAPMVQVFRDACRRATQGGPMALFGLWARTVFDLMKTAIEEHARGGVQMTREKFFRLSGWALMAGPVLFFIGWLANSRPEYNPYNAAALPIDPVANLVAMPLAAVGLAFTSLGLWGMLLRYGTKAGGSALWLGLGMVSSLASSAGAVWMVLDNNGYGWMVFFLGLFGLFFGIAIFGAVNLGLRLMPRWNGLPLLAGVWIPGFLMFAGLFQLGTGSVLISPETVFTYLWAFSLLMFFGLGYLLQSSSSKIRTANI